MNASKLLNKRKVELSVLLVMVVEFAFPHATTAYAAEVNTSIMLPKLTYRAAVPSEHIATENGRIVLIATEQGEKTISAAPVEPVVQDEEKQVAPAVKAYAVKKEYVIPITAYTSEVAQTDASPCITANGYNVCEAGEENVIAANFLPFGTKVQFPDLFGDRVFTVQDRMNKRYYYKADIWMKDKKDAIQFGKKTSRLVVIE